MIHYFIFTIFVVFVSSINAIEDVMSYYIKQENPLNLQLIHLSSFNDILPRKQCLFDEALMCFKKGYEDGSCMIKVKKNSNEVFETSIIEIEHSDIFREYFERCVGKNIHSYTTSTEKEIIIPTLQDSEDDDINKNKIIETTGFKHFKCIKNEIQECFFQLKCLMKSHDKIIDEILPFCRLEALEKMNVSDSEPIKAYNNFEDIKQLSTHKLGKIHDPNVSKLPSKTIEIFQNLTYGHLEAIKMALIPWPKIKKDFCDPFSTSTFTQPSHPKNEKILSSFFVRYPYMRVSKEIKNILQNITAEQFQSIKEVINVSTHFRWIICKSVVILSTPIKTVTKVQKNDCNNKNENETKKFEPTLSNLKICRKWVLEDEFNKSGICK